MANIRADAFDGKYKARCLSCVIVLIYSMNNLLWKWRISFYLYLNILFTILLLYICT